MALVNPATVGILDGMTDAWCDAEQPQWLVVEAPLHLRVGRELVRGVGRFTQLHRPWQILIAEEARAVVDRGEALAGAVVLPAWKDPASQAFCERIQQMNLAQVWVGAVREHPDRVVLQADNVAVGRLAAEHLLGLGLRRLAFYGNERPPFSRQRRAGFEARIAEAGARMLKIPFERESIRRVEQSIEPRLIQWLRRCERPIGLFADNDVAAVRLQIACRLAGLHIGEDVAILGVDNDEVRCQSTLPPLSSIETGYERLGFHAGELLARMRAGHAVEPQVIAFPPVGVVHRGSTELTAVRDPLVLETLRYLWAHHAEVTLSVDAVAAAVGLPRRSLERRFRAAMHATLHQELVRLRMRHAERLLHETDRAVESIARAVGYASLDNFYRTFRRWHRTTPARYRQASREGQGENTSEDVPAGHAHDRRRLTAD